MTEEQQEALEAVEKINNNQEDYLLGVTFAGETTIIELEAYSDELPRFVIYNSANESRKFFILKNEYESFYDLIKRKFALIKKEIIKITI